MEAHLRLGGLAKDGVGEGVEGVGRRGAVRGAAVLARDEVSHRHLGRRLRPTGTLADAGGAMLRAPLRSSPSASR
jgi:hypothetical protein